VRELFSQISKSKDGVLKPLPVGVVFCDLETTGMFTWSSEPLTGHFIWHSLESDESNEFSLEFKPEFWGKDADEASKIHGISYVTASFFPEKKDGLRTILQKVKGPSIFICHANRDAGKFSADKRPLAMVSTFDWQILAAQFFDLGAMNLWRQRCPEHYILSTHSFAKWIRSKGMASIPDRLDLKTLANHFEIDLGEHHDAKHDTRTCMRIFKALCALDDPWEYLKHANNWGPNEQEQDQCAGETVAHSGKRKRARIKK
jgi:DNA polymerase III epsilon subunit-like protein